MNSENSALTVLLIDDDRMLLRTLGDILRHRGYDVLVAETGRGGLDMISAGAEPAIALIDLGLPDMDGIEVVQELHRKLVTAELIILTGNASIDSALAGLREEVCDYAIKPIAPDMLFPLMDRAGERWRRRRTEQELLHSEYRFQMLLEGMSDTLVAVLACGDPVTFQYVSPSVTEILGYDPDALLGQPLWPAHADDDAQLRVFLEHAIAQQGFTGTVEFRVQNSRGTWCLLEFAAQNLAHRPEIGGLLCIARDVTERRRADAQMVQAQKLETVGSLAGGVAHDFNNLLTAILGYGELALSHPNLETGVVEDIDEMLLAAQRASALTRQLLAFSRRQAAKPETLSVNVVVEDLVRMLRRLVPESIELALDLRDDVHLVTADPAQIEQVIVNLSVNARDAMPDGGTLRIKSENVMLGAQDLVFPGLSPGPYVCLSVEDTGTGMTEDVRARVFEPFFTTKDVGKGTGLGLATCYGIVKESGGQIAITSAPGAGTTIRLHWPVSDAAGTMREKTRNVGAAIQPGQGNVLVVDDDEAIRSLIVRALTGSGYTVWSAADGEAALQIAREPGRALHLLVSDVVLPRLSGPQIAEAVLAEHPSVRVLLMSGYHDRVADIQSIRPNGILAKPFTPSTLHEAVRQALASARADVA